MPHTLLSERTVKRWVASSASNGSDDREDALYHRIRDTLGEDAAHEFEDVVGAASEGEQARVLTYVGTVLMQHGLEDLWKQIFDATYGAGLMPQKNGHLQFLAEQMAAVRAGNRDQSTI